MSMDKLAKALQKARDQREQVMHSGAVPPSPAPSYGTPITLPTGDHILRVSELSLEQHRIIAHHTRSKDADIFRILRSQVLQVMGQSGLKTLGITSANYGDGKTTIALNLALSIALDVKQTVLLVDLDLRKPNVMEYLGLSSALGLTDYFSTNTPIAECLVRPSFDRLSILPAGRMLDHSSEVLGSPKIAALAQELKARYADRLIIYDLPPILAQDDPIVFLPHVDAVLMVVNEGVTTANAVRQSMRALAGANVIGTVLNHSEGRKTPGKIEKLIPFRRS